MRKILLLTLVMSFLVIGFAKADNHDPNIDLATAKAMHERGVLFVDVRNQDEFDLGHIPDAIFINIREIDFLEKFTQAVEDKEREVVFYCRGTSCSRSSDAVRLVTREGYVNAYNLGVGMPGWKGAGYEVQK